MTVWQFAIYRYASQHMTPEEHARAFAFAKRADRGDPVAQGLFLQLVCDVLADSRRHQQPADKK